MGFCCTYKKNNPYIRDLEDVIIDFHGSENMLVPFLEAFPEQRVVISINEPFQEEFLSIFLKLNGFHNWVLRLTEINDDLLKQIEDNYIPYFFKHIITDWDRFFKFLETRVTDIYISETLGFELNKISKVAHEKNKKIRVFPNIAQAGAQINPLKTFFIRPEDIEIYSEYVDIFEFWETPEINTTTLCKIYMDQKKWAGPLKEIILGLDSDINNAYIPFKRWGSNRVKCGKRCFKGDYCNSCENTYVLAKNLEESQLMIKSDRYIEIPTEEIDEKVVEQKQEELKEIQQRPVPNF